MESCYGYDLGDIRYVKPMLGDPAHWVRRLPGGLFHNIISHGIGRIAEYFPATEPEIVPLAFTSAPLARTGTGIADELRVMFLDRQSGATAYFTFSTQMRPLLHQFRLYGARNGLVVDDDSRVLLELTGRRRKSYLEQFLPPLGFARQSVRWAIRNGLDFARRELHNDMGMKNLIEAFYRSIVDGGPPPIPYDEILTTARLMDQIFHLVFGAAERRVSGTMQVA
jgi:predicted dehydrogenase